MYSLLRVIDKGVLVWDNMNVMFINNDDIDSITYKIAPSTYEKLVILKEQKTDKMTL